MLTGRHILSCDHIDDSDLAPLFQLAHLLEPLAKGTQYSRVLEGAILGSLFFEPSTRTRLSFNSAFMRLGGAVSATTGAGITSLTKGESLADTSNVISGYVDCMVVRHPDEHSVFEMASVTHVPIINAGNGAGEHPTQALLDVFTIDRELNRLGRRLQNSTVVLAGDLRFGRAVHSLVQLLARLRPQTVVLWSPANLRLPDTYKACLESHQVDLFETESAEKALKHADVLYATRIQRERFPEGEEAGNYSRDFCVNRELLQRYAQPHTFVMHPLPRDAREGSNDLSMDLNGDDRLAIFRQTDGGLQVRMALFASVMGVADQVASSLQKSRWFTPQYTRTHDAAFHVRKPK